MTTKWRPKDWKNPYDITFSENPQAGDLLAMLLMSEKLKAFDEGADAMLEALMELARQSPTGTFTFDSHVQHLI